MSSTVKGGLIGAAAGAGTGFIIDSQTGGTGIATAVGAGVGAVSGAVIGNSMDAQVEEQEQLVEQQRMHQFELNRQKREIEDMRRQQRYDDLYRRTQSPQT